MAPFRARRYGLGDSQAACMFLETLNTKELFADGLAIVPWKFWLGASEDARMNVFKQTFLLRPWAHRSWCPESERNNEEVV